MVPFIAASDHTVFLDGGVPAMQFNHWPDNFYHSSEDRIDFVDPTELKRIGVVAGLAFAYLSTAGPQEARDLAWESAARGEMWLSEVARQSARLLGNDAATIHDRYKAAPVDEFQDTNRAQYQFIQLLGAKQRNIAVVGDDAQSIYSFRGADIRNILDFEKDYPDCKLFRRVCTPDEPVGPCMVSSEGSCATYHLYGEKVEGVGGRLGQRR
jgi:hypothetical protein